MHVSQRVMSTCSDLVRTNLDHIRRLAKVDRLELVADLSTEKGFARSVVGEAAIEVPLEGLVDFDKERKRLETDLAKLKAEQEGLTKRLANSDFVSRAAPDIVASTRARHEEMSGQISRLSGIIEGF